MGAGTIKVPVSPHRQPFVVGSPNGRTDREATELSDDESGDPIRNLAIVATAGAILGGALVVAGALDGRPGWVMLGAFVAGIPLAFYWTAWKVEFISDLPWVRRRYEARRRRRVRTDGRWTRHPEAPPTSRQQVPGGTGSFQAMPLYGPGTCPTCGGTLFYGRLNCPHCSAPVFRSDDGTRPPEL